MGVTGSGKSKFIECASGLDGVGIGHNYESCTFHVPMIYMSSLISSGTVDVTPFEFDLDGRHITLIDTPGFNDTTRSEAEVLTEIANYLDFTYRNPPHLKLNGIVYLQSIEDPRMYGSSLRNLKMFKDLCGESPLKNVLLVTNRWEKARHCGDFDKAVAKENELRDSPKFWQPLIQRGSRMVRWDGRDAHEAARDILRMFVHATPEVLQIQKELVEQHKNLVDTTAGTTVNEEAIRMEKEYQGELNKIRKELEDAALQRDEEVKEALEISKKDYEQKLSKIRQEQDLLHYERRSEARRLQNEMDDLRGAYNKEVEKKLSEQKLDFDHTVAQLMANQDKLREEQRLSMLAEIALMQKQKKEKRSGVKLVLSLVPLLGTMVFGALGIPLGVGDSLFGSDDL